MDIKLHDTQFNSTDGRDNSTVQTEEKVQQYRRKRQLNSTDGRYNSTVQTEEKCQQY